MWPLEALLAGVRDRLQREASGLDAAQSVRGLDGLDELGFHPLLAEGVEAAGLGVLREQVYPASELGSVGARPQRRDRMRCDLVTTPEPGQSLADEIAELSERDKAVGTLFSEQAAAEPVLARGVRFEEALWLEVKVAAQHRDGAGPGPAGTLTGCVDDARKLAEEGRIEAGALLVVHFTESREHAERDLAALMHAIMDQRLPVRSPLSDGFEITERIGNAWCAIWLVPVFTP